MTAISIDSIDGPVAHEHRPLAHDVMLMLCTKAAILVLGVLGTVVVARTLGPTGRGAIAIAFSFSLLLVQFGSLGFQVANPYFAARDPKRIGEIVLNTIWGVIMVGAIMACGALLAKAWLPASLRGLNWLDVVVVAFGAPALLAMQWMQSVFWPRAVCSPTTASNWSATSSCSWVCSWASSFCTSACSARS